MSVRMQAHDHAFAPGHGAQGRRHAAPAGNAEVCDLLDFGAVNIVPPTGRRFGVGLFSLRQSDVVIALLAIAILALWFGTGLR